MLISELDIYEALREKMDEKQARALVQYIETRVEQKFEQAQKIFSTKEDIHRLELRLSEMKLETEQKFAIVNQKIAESKNDLIKWLFGMIMGSTVAIIGTILTVMKMGGW